jgi:hypothetical protein
MGFFTKKQFSILDVMVLCIAGLCLADGMFLSFAVILLGWSFVTAIAEVCSK